jgi:hypothetical protein
MLTVHSLDVNDAGVRDVSVLNMAVTVYACTG